MESTGIPARRRGCRAAHARGVLVGQAGARHRWRRQVTVTSPAFGQTTIKQPPKRVVSAGYTEQDDLLAVGVVPIAVTNWFGDQPFAVWPWAQPKLGAANRWC